jgi:hypothetical protein
MVFTFTILSLAQSKMQVVTVLLYHDIVESRNMHTRAYGTMQANR